VSARKEEIASLTSQIEELDDQLLTLDKQDTAAKDLRDKEENLYKKTDSDLGDTISAVESALSTLQDASAYDDFMQVKAKVRVIAELVQTVASAEQQAVLREFVTDDPDLTERPDFQADGDRAAHVKRYAFKSGKVIELLKQLVQKFEADLLAATKAETNAVDQYNLAKSARANERAAAEKSRGIKDTDKSSADTDKGKAEQELQQTQSDLKADSDLLAKTVQSCESKAASWEERQKIRSLELEAMEEAIKIISQVTGVRTEPPENPVPPTSPLFLQVRRQAASFLQVRADPRTRAVQLLRTAARKTKSQALERFAQELSAHLTGPFDEVNNMMEKMIHHLMAEQKDEDDHKNWCDLELNKTEASISDKQDKMDELEVKIREATANVAKLIKAIDECNEMVAKIDMHMKESAEIREIGKKENAAASKDAKDAQEALANAIAVLETHYKETNAIEKASYEFVQNKAPATLPNEPSTWTASYTGVIDNDGNGPGDGIIAVLKKVNEDFAKMEADTAEQEASDEKFYKEEMSASEIEKATQLKDAEAKEEEKKREVEEAALLTAERKHVSDEHMATDIYLKDLQKACVDGTSSYEDRKEARDDEIEALHKAKDILKEAFEDKTR